VELFEDVHLRTVLGVSEAISRAYKALPPRDNSTDAAQLHPKVIIHGILRIDGDELNDGDLKRYLEMVWQTRGLVITDTTQIRTLGALSQLFKVGTAAKLYGHSLLAGLPLHEVALGVMP
jgi:hypothetical protein